MKGLDAVLAQRTRLRDQLRGVLAELLRVDSQWSAESGRLEDEAGGQLAEVAGLVGAGAVDVRAAAARRYHAATLRREAAALEARRSALALEVAEARRRLAEADAARKAVERLLEKRRDEAAREADRRAQLAAEDDHAAARHPSR